MKVFNTLFLLSITFLSCTKQKPKPVNGELKAAFDLKVGTYWIYRDSVSGVTDSFFVTSNETSVYPVSLLTENGNSVNVISIDISDYTNGALDSTSWSWQLSENLLFASMQTGNNSIGYDPLLQIPIVINQSPIIYSLDISQVLNIYPSFLLNGKAYINTAEVLHYQSTYDSTSSKFYYDRFYINETDGIIKMSLRRNTGLRVLELQRDNIVK